MESLKRLNEIMYSPEFLRGLIIANLPMINLSRSLYGMTTFDTVDEYLEYRTGKVLSVDNSESNTTDENDVMATYVKHLHDGAQL